MKKLSLLLCTLAISGCSWFSSEDDIAITPAELVDFTAEVSMETRFLLPIIRVRLRH